MLTGKRLYSSTVNEAVDYYSAKTTSFIYCTSPDPVTGHTMEFERHTFGTQIAGVGVDIDAGEVSVEKLVTIHSCGTVINPNFVDGQLYGGVHMGLGQALMEEMSKRDDGSVISNTFFAYHILAADMPRIIIADTVECPAEDGALGAGGMSEGVPSPAAAAVGEAVSAALGTQITSSPLIPEYVLVQNKEWQITTSTPCVCFQ